MMVTVTPDSGASMSTARIVPEIVPVSPAGDALTSVAGGSAGAACGVLPLSASAEGLSLDAGCADASGAPAPIPRTTAASDVVRELARDVARELARDVARELEGRGNKDCNLECTGPPVVTTVSTWTRNASMEFQI
jgi:hypothetical protein